MDCKDSIRLNIAGAKRNKTRKVHYIIFDHQKKLSTLSKLEPFCDKVN